MFSPKWQKYFMEAAIHASTISKDPSSKCGAVLVNDDKDIVISGYNGFPPGVYDYPEWLEDREAKYKTIIHAEMNAIIRCPVSTRGLHLFTTMPSCSNCTKHIIAAGISSVFWLNSNESYAERWKDNLMWSRKLYDAAKIPYFELDSEAFSR